MNPAVSKKHFRQKVPSLPCRSPRSHVSPAAVPLAAQPRIPPGEAGSVGRAAETLRVSRSDGHAGDDALRVRDKEGGFGDAPT